VREALGVTAPPRHFDTVVMGRNTHQPALDAGLTSAYPHLDGYVVTHRRDLPADPSVTFVHEPPVRLVRELKRRHGSDIWLCGGSDLAGQLVDEIDELHLKVYPVLVGEGIPLVGRQVAPIQWVLQSSQALPSGVQINRYARA
jgi:dihydrofolate reductase